MPWRNRQRKSPVKSCHVDAWDKDPFEMYSLDSFNNVLRHDERPYRAGFHLFRKEESTSQKSRLRSDFGKGTGKCDEPRKSCDGTPYFGNPARLESGAWSVREHRGSHLSGRYSLPHGRSCTSCSSLQLFPI